LITIVNIIAILQTRPPFIPLIAIAKQSKHFAYSAFAGQEKRQTTKVCLMSFDIVVRGIPVGKMIKINAD